MQLEGAQAMNVDSKGEIEELNLEAQEMISGGTGPNDFDMEYWQRYFQECQETAQQSLKKEPDPHSKRAPGKLIKR